MLQTDNNKRKTADWAEEGREGVALDGVQRLLSLLYCGENASYTGFLAISRIDRRETTREEEEEEEGTSCIVTDFYTIYIYETKFRETVFRDLIE